MSRFLFGLYVEDDLREIRDYIAKESPESARRLKVRFVEAFRLLAKHPELGHVREDLPVPALRFWPVGNNVCGSAIVAGEDRILDDSLNLRWKIDSHGGFLLPPYWRFHCCVKLGQDELGQANTGS